MHKSSPIFLIRPGHVTDRGELRRTLRVTAMEAKICETLETLTRPQDIAKVSWEVTATH